jgi:hypothetical protein
VRANVEAAYAELAAAGVALHLVIPYDDLSAYTGAPAPTDHFADLPADHFARPAPYAARRPLQPQLPPFPTTTIGSFPQTPAIRRARLQYKRGVLGEAEYKEAMAAAIGYAVGVQDALGLDGEVTYAPAALCRGQGIGSACLGRGPRQPQLDC